MKKNEFFLSLSIENIEEKINKLNSSKEKVEKEKLSELREKLNKALNFLKELTVNKLEEKNKSDYDITKFKLDKPSIIQFIKNEKDTNNEIAIILNLYFIIRKNLNESMNKSFHNKSLKINFMGKEEISRFEKEKKNKEENSNKISEEIGKIQESKDKNYHNIIIQSNLCPKDEIFKKIEKIPIKPIIIEEYQSFLEEIQISKKEIDLDSNLSEFYQHLKNMKAKIYDFRSELKFSEAVELYMEGEKNDILQEKEINEDNKIIIRSDFEEDKKKINKLLKESSESISIKKMKSYFDNIIKEITKNLLSLNSIHFKAIEYIKDYAEFFDIDLMIKNLNISVPIDVSEIINNIINKSRKSNDIDYVEQSFFMCQICMYLILKEKIKYLNKIHKKLLNLQLEEKIKLFEVKDLLIDELKDKISFENIRENLMVKVWNNIKKQNVLIINNENLNKEIKSYVKQKDPETFKKDLNRICSSIIEKINLKEPEPQNLFLIQFMKQFGLEYKL